MKKNIIISYGLLSAIVLFSVLAMAMPVSAQVQMADEFGVNDAMGYLNTYVEVPVNIMTVTNGPIQTIKFDVLYTDSVISLESVQVNGLTTGWIGSLGANKKSITLTTFDQTKAIANGSTGSVVLLNFSLIVPGESPMGISNIDFSNIGNQHGTAPAKNGTFTVSSQAPTVSIGSADNISVCNDVVVSINITDASNIGGMDISVTYDASVLTATGVANGSMMVSLPDLIWAYNLSSGRINISLSTYPGMINGTGELFVVTFHADAVGNSTLDINVTEASTGDVPPQPVTPITVDGYVNVPGGLLGDVNNNGVIDADDSFKTLRASVGLETVDLNIADVNNNGVIDADDSFKILRASVGLEIL